MFRKFAPALLLLSLFCSKERTSEEASATQAPAPAAASETTTTAAAPVATTAPAAAAPGAAAPSGLATADGETSGVTAVVHELKRTSGGTVSLKLSITNGGSEDVSFGYDFADPAHDVADFGSIGGIQLIDEANRKKYFVVRDSAGKAVASQKISTIKPGETRNLWARFPAPPPEVQKISIIIPHFSPMDDVTIQ
jgi:hypothetical protein